MESWIQRLFLSTTLALALPCVAEQASKDEHADILDDVVKPDIKRRDVNEDLIDSENFEFGISGGVMSVEDFGSNNSMAVHAAYHVSEDWFVEATYGATTTSKTSYEVLADQNLLTEKERELSYGELALGLNLFPGEIFIGKNHAFNASMYVLAGAGSTQFGGDDHLTFSYGAGARFFATDWAALRLGFNNRIFSHSIFGVDKTIQNLEANLGLSIFF
ncbi:outer membrane beta-barrel domain-containing protein [Agaribacterium sp. ZY112]|uniref:outer membrane beta-barrel domain-containing protein n=1 Tax=Agaribacterium sp. ZY112 TaxID=3233574 RepID=UPI003523B5C6